MKKQDAPDIISINPNYTEFKNDSSIATEYTDCHWSTNYGYFFTINSETFLTEKRVNDFIISKCMQEPDYQVFWTYDVSDYAKAKPPVIVSLQIENILRENPKTKRRR